MSKAKKTSIEVKQQLETLKKELEQKHNLYLRALADYQNLEKRTQEERKKMLDEANKILLKALLPIKNDIDKAEEFEKSQGLQLIKQKFEEFFNKYQVQELEVLNKEFSPQTMECIEVQEADKENTVLKVHQKAYLYKGELLQPAKVTVGKLKVSNKQN